MQEEFAHIEQLISTRDIKKAEVAIAKLLRSTLLDMQQATLLTLRARVRLLASRPDEALHDIQEAETLQPDLFSAPDNIELLADCYLSRFELATMGFAQKSDVQQAQSLYRRIIEQHSDYENLGWVHYQRGRAALIADDVQDAVAHFHNALAAASPVSALSGYCYERLGFIAYYEERDSEQALAYLDKAIESYPVSEPRLWLGQVYLLRCRVLRESDLQAALESARLAYDITSGTSANNGLAAEALFTIAELLAQQTGREHDVIDYLQRFLKISKTPLGVDVTWSRAYEMLGDAYAATAQYEQAAAAYANTLRYNPDHPWHETVKYRLARAYYQLRQYMAAIETLVGLLEGDYVVTDYRIHHLLGNALYATGQYMQAAAAYSTAIHLAPPGTNVETIRAYYRLSQQMNQPS